MENVIFTLSTGVIDVLYCNIFFRRYWTRA